jgi:hypothetical protein
MVTMELPRGVGCTTLDARKRKFRDLVVCFNVILFYVEVSVVKGDFI